MACLQNRSVFRERGGTGTHSAGFHVSLHDLFYRSCCINSATEARSASTHASADDRAFTHSVINFYHLSDVATPEEEASRHKTVIQDKGWDICGRIYISYQGINAQFSGPWQDALAYTQWVASQPEFQELNWREYPVPKQMFPKLKLKFRPNLISLQGGMESLPITDKSSRATPVPPADWKRMLRDSQPITPSSAPAAPSSSSSSTTDEPSATPAAGSDAKATLEAVPRPGALPQKPVVLDVRNAYEWDAGHFEGAERPLEDAFNETPREADDGGAALPEALKSADPETPVMMYCTGGIRCDVYSTFLRQQGFNNLYTLEGGIQNYLETESADHWKGSLFVFDDRMAVAPSHLRLSRIAEDHSRRDDVSEASSEERSEAIAAGGIGGNAQLTSAQQAVLGTHGTHASPLPSSSSPGVASSATSSVGAESGGTVGAATGVPGEGAWETPKAAVPCALCGGEPELPHVNCANIDCNVLLLICGDCKAALSGCCSEECRDHAPRLVRPIKDGAYRGMMNYTPKQHGARQRLMTPQRAAKLAEARERRRARLRVRQDEKVQLKQQRKQLARLAMEAQEAVKQRADVADSALVGTAGGSGGRSPDAQTAARL